MIFSKATLSRRGLGRDENWQLDTNGYRAHELVWKLFSDEPDRERDFVFRWEVRPGHLPELLVVSKRPPRDDDGLFDRLQSKTYDPKVSRGDVLAFRTRVNPVVKTRDEEGKQKVHDVVMNAKHAARSDDSPPDRQELVQSSVREWLATRAEPAGFDTGGEVLAESYQRHEFRKRKGGRKVVIATVDIDGLLTVRDPERFRRTLFEGLGPSKAFGCGLLMVRRAG